MGKGCVCHQGGRVEWSRARTWGAERGDAAEEETVKSHRITPPPSNYSDSDGVEVESVQGRERTKRLWLVGCVLLGKNCPAPDQNRLNGEKVKNYRVEVAQFLFVGGRKSN